jgi:hypothetical protein
MDGKLFFHLLALTILNSFILPTSCDAKLTHRDFRHPLVKDQIQEGRRVHQTTPRERPTPLTVILGDAMFSMLAIGLKVCGFKPG